jgi:hypothetical protein
LFSASGTRTALSATLRHDEAPLCERTKITGPGVHVNERSEALRFPAPVHRLVRPRSCEGFIIVDDRKAITDRRPTRIFRINYKDKRSASVVIHFETKTMEPRAFDVPIFSHSECRRTQRTLHGFYLLHDVHGADFPPDQPPEYPLP